MSVLEDKQLSERFTDAEVLPQGSYLYKSFVVRDQQAGWHVVLKCVSKRMLDGLAHETASLAKTLGQQTIPGVAAQLEVLETDEHVVLVYEYFGGGDVIARAGKWRVPEDEAKTVFRQLAAAVAAIHASGRVHGEVRADNVFFGSPLHVFLGDAGTCSLFGPAAVRKALLAVPQHAPPELVEQNRNHNLAAPLEPSSDVWGLGIVLFTLLSGQHPFAGRSFDDILTAHFSMDQVRWKSYSHQAQRLVQRLLVRDPRQRPTAAEVLADPWLSDAAAPPADVELLRTPPKPKVRETVELPPEAEDRRASSGAAALRKSNSAAEKKRQRDDAEEEKAAAVAEQPALAQAKSAAKAAVAVAVAVAVAPEKKAKAEETSESLMALKVTDLKARCKEMGLPQSGKKSDLVDRILAALAAK